MTTYLKVGGLRPHEAHVTDAYGFKMMVSKAILEGMYSADHYQKEVPMNMSGLAELL